MSRAPGAGLCPRCGAAADANQEYCLACGARLAPADGLPARLGAAWKRRFRRYPGDWIWPALALLAIAALGGLVAVASTRRDASAAGSVVVATGPLLSVASPTTGPVTLPTVAPPAATAVPLLRPRRRPLHVSAAARPVAAWPAGRNGYTVVLESMPKPSGRAAAVAEARRARAAGLRRVGVLDSDRYSSFHPGYFVVFSGVYGSYSQAAERLDGAQAAGYAAAYPRRVTT